MLLLLMLNLWQANCVPASVAKSALMLGAGHFMPLMAPTTGKCPLASSFPQTQSLRINRSSMYFPSTGFFEHRKDMSHGFRLLLINGLQGKTRMPSRLLCNDEL